jgi:hypothetical protein
MIRNFRVVFAVVLTAAFAGGRAPLSAQTNTAVQNPCEFVTADEVQALVPKEHADAGVPISLPAFDSYGCRYTWGVGVERSTLMIAVNAASRAFAGLNPDAIKRELAAQVVPGTADAPIADVGEAGAFKAYSPAYASASAYVKEHLVQVAFSGIDAPDRKTQLLSLLKSAASRL